jgi:hypothetical protein
VVFLDTVAVEFGEFFVWSFGHKPPDAEHLFVKVWVFLVVGIVVLIVWLSGVVLLLKLLDE